MSELDVLKEKIAHLRMWLNLSVVTDIGLVAWFLANYDTPKNLLLVLDVLAIVSVSAFIWMLNRRIETYIEQLRDL